MKVLVVYGTTEGQTRKIAERIATRIRDHGPHVDLFDSTSLADDLAVGAYDAVVVAASVHQHRHQSSITHFVQANLTPLQTKPTAFVSVSLAAMDDEYRDDAQKYVDDFLADTGWRPSETALVAGALVYTKYDFLKRQIMKMIVRRGGGPTDASQDYEFTDWDALSQFVDTFLERASP